MVIEWPHSITRCWGHRFHSYHKGYLLYSRLAFPKVTLVFFNNLTFHNELRFLASYNDTCMNIIESNLFKSNMLTTC